MTDPTTELRGLLHALSRALEWQVELGAMGRSLRTVAAPHQTAAAPPPARGAPATQPPVSAPSEPLVAEVAPVAVEAASTRETLASIRSDLGDCQRCKLCSGRKNIVYGAGNEHADLMFVGEAPGADEDREGIPFVGRAGQLLTRMIAAMGLTREDVYIANIVKCRPPQNRDPEQDEILACEPFLIRQIESIQPKLIVSLGRVSAQTLLRVTTPISLLRGRWRDYHGVKLMPTFHPAYLLRSPDKKREVWEDLQAVMAELGLQRADSQ